MMSNSEEPQGNATEPNGEAVSARSASGVPRARLTRLKINRFRNVTPGTELRFDNRINVLLGRNGSGKTTLLDLVCGLVRGDLRAYQHENFDLEFDLSLGDHHCSTATQNTASPTSALNILGHSEHSASWKYTVSLFGSSGRVALVEATPHTTTVTLSEEGDMKTPLEERSLFDLLFYVAPFLRIRQPGTPPFSNIIAEAFSVHRNCLRLDEGLDVFRSISDGTPLPIIGRPLSTGFSARRIATELEWYAPNELVMHIDRQHPSLHERMEITVEQSSFKVLDAFARACDVRSTRCSLTLLDRKRDMETGATVSRFGKPTFWITTHRGTTFTHNQLSYGEKRLLAFLYHAAANPQILVADELVNGLHHGWIQACLDAIQGQAFLTSQNPLLLDYLPFNSAEEVQRRFILCDRDEHGDWIWRNMDQDAADAFYRAYDVGIQHVSEILETKGLW